MLISLRGINKVVCLPVDFISPFHVQYKWTKCCFNQQTSLISNNTTYCMIYSSDWLIYRVKHDVPVQTYPILTIDDRGEDSNAGKVWVGDSLVKDQTTDTAEGREWHTIKSKTICYHTRWHRSGRQPEAVGKGSSDLDEVILHGEVAYWWLYLLMAMAMMTGSQPE